ncbi:MAG: pyrroline-5-carboxylate reductase [Pseudomonadales bacterium]
MNDTTIACIGAGNMAQSLLRGLLASGHPANRLRASDPVETLRDRMTALGVATFADNAAAIANADVIVLAVKPQVLRAVCTPLQITEQQLVISIAAGVPLASIERWTGSTSIVRCMPNTPALLQAGITGLYAGARVSAADRARAAHVLGAVGRTLWVEQESALDAVTAVSGSGPAYFFHLMEAMIDGGVALGLDRATAAALTLETAYGAALMARQPGADAATLRQQVTSPGGTTQHALEVMFADDLADTMKRALAAAAERSRELAEEFGRP